MNIQSWAKKWGVSPEALKELHMALGLVNTDPTTPAVGNNEAAVQVRIRLEASDKGGILWRNNVGALKDLRGVPVRYGLANESKAMNEAIKSSDLIGIRPVVIQPYHVGQTLGQFVAREVKEPTWEYSATLHEVAQLRFLNLVASLGGDACFATGEGTL